MSLHTAAMIFVSILSLSTFCFQLNYEEHSVGGPSYNKFHLPPAVAVFSQIIVVEMTV